MSEGRSPTIADGWGSFEAAALPPDAGPDRRREMKRAFFAGSWNALVLMVELSGSERLTEEQSIEAIEGLRREMEDFNRAIQEGRA